VRGTVGEEVVDDQADYWEEEDHDTPEDLVWHWAVRFQDFQEDDDIEDEDDETDEATSGTKLPGVTVALGGDWCCHRERKHGQLEEETEGCGEHDCDIDC